VQSNFGCTQSDFIVCVRDVDHQHEGQQGRCTARSRPLPTRPRQCFCVAGGVDELDAMPRMMLSTERSCTLDAGEVRVILPAAPYMRQCISICCSTCCSNPAPYMQQCISICCSTCCSNPAPYMQQCISPCTSTRRLILPAAPCRSYCSMASCAYTGGRVARIRVLHPSLSS
jgi:hypothetical protein